jgi:hypothetical protein
MLINRPNSHASIIVLLLLIAGLAASHVMNAQNADARPKLTVCELLKQPSKFNRRMIELRGIYFQGGHGLFVAGDGCDEVLITKGKRWQSLIWLQLSREQTERRGMNFEQVTKAEMEIATAKLREMRRHDPQAKITKVIVTYVGLFETRDDFDSMIGAPADDRPVGSGFGDQGIAPGQLIIDSAKDIVVKFEGE